MTGYKPVEVQLDEPSVVVVSPTPYSGHHQGETRWGCYQFPCIQGLDDGRLAVSYSMHVDSSVSYGMRNPVCVSMDDGLTWQKSDTEDSRFSLVSGADRHPICFPDGEMIVYPQERPLDAATLKLPSRHVSFTDNYGRRSDCYRLSDLPDELQGIRVLRRMPGEDDWSEEWAKLRVPNLAVHVFRWEGTEKGMVDPNILIQPTIVTNFFWTIAPDGGVLVFHYLRLFDSDGTLAQRASVVVLRSDDRGRSWRLWGVPGHFADEQAACAAVRPFLEDPDSNYNRLWGGKQESPVPNLDTCLLGEPSVISFGDGRMICVMRSDSGKSTHQPMFLSRSIDWGKIWTTPEILTPFGVMPRLVHLDSGVIALVYGRPGVQLLFCTDGIGEVWHSPMTLLPEAGEKTRMAAGPRQVDTTPQQAGMDDTCANCSVLKTGPDSFLVAYSDFRHPGDDGRLYKAIKVQRITVRPKGD